MEFRTPLYGQDILSLPGQIRCQDHPVCTALQSDVLDAFGQCVDFPDPTRRRVCSWMHGVYKYKPCF